MLATNVFTTLRLAIDDSAITTETIRKCTKSTIRRNCNDILSIKTTDNCGDTTSMTSKSILCPNNHFFVDAHSRELPPVVDSRQTEMKMKMVTKKMTDVVSLIVTVRYTVHVRVIKLSAQPMMRDRWSLCFYTEDGIESSEGTSSYTSHFRFKK